MVRVPELTPSSLPSCRDIALFSFGDLTGMAKYRCHRGGVQGDHNILGIIYHDHVVDVRPLHELHPPTEEDPSCP